MKNIVSSLYSKVDSIRCVVLVDTFPCETFVIRQVCALNADVATGEIDAAKLNELNLSSKVTSLTGGKSLKGGTIGRVVNRLKNIISGNWLPWWSNRAERGWRKYLKTNRPDVVLAQFGPNAMRSMGACSDYNIPLIAHFHGYDASELLQMPSYCEKLRDVFEYTAACVVVSHVMKETMIKLGCKAGKLYVIPCGVPISEFPVSYQQQQQPCHFVSVGRFVEKKAPGLVVRAFEYCARAVPGVRLTMIGDGPLLDATIELVRQSQFRSQISIKGRQSIEKVTVVMQSAGCFVQHSVTTANGDQEGWPVSIAEAASTGLPVIATRHAGIPEQVIDRVTGFLVEEFDWESMGKKMIAVAEAPVWRKEAGILGRNHMEENGSFAQSALKLQSLIKSIVDS